MTDATAKIDKYLSGLMDADERAAFEKELEANPALAEELALHRDMDLFLKKRTQRQALQTQLRQLGEQHLKAEETSGEGRVVRRTFSRFRLGLAAAATIALLVVAWFALRPSLYEQYATHPALALTEKATDATQLGSEAETAFNNGDYRAAIPLLEQWLDQHPDDDMVRAYLGIALMESGRVDEARNLFEQLQTAAPEVQDFARWNLALSFLKTGEKARCKEVLKSIPESSAYYTKARELLEKLGG